MRRIGLIALDRLNRDTLCYALKACQRLDAHLDILTTLPPDETHRMVIEARGTADTPWRVIQIGGDHDDDVFRYASNESGLLFLTSSAGDEEARSLRDTSVTEGSQLGIAWVVVEGK